MSLPTSFSRFGAFAGAAVLVASLAACGSANSSDTQSDAGASGASAGESAPLSGNLAGAGASSQEAAMEAWKAGFAAVQPDVAVSYDAVGSGAGVAGSLPQAVRPSASRRAPTAGMVGIADGRAMMTPQLTPVECVASHQAIG